MRVELFISSWFFSQLVVFVRSSGNQNNQMHHNTLKCYQCEITGKDPNHTCKEEDLKICPNEWAADRCMTSIQRNSTGHYIITKSCALAPCKLSEIQNAVLNLPAKCDQTKANFSCYTCCDFDGCNLHSKGSRDQLSFLLPLSVLASIFKSI